MDAALRRKLMERIRPDDRVLLWSAQNRELVRELAARVPFVEIHEVDFLSLRDLKKTVGDLSNLIVAETFFSPAQPAFTRSIILSPRGREFARAQLWNVYQSLLENGELYITGGNDEGIKSVIRDAGRLFTSVRTLAIKDRQRLGVAEKCGDSAAYPQEWGEVPSHMQQRILQTPLGDVPVGTLPGVFSWQALDAGTAFLLSQAAVRDYAADADMLDMGCGNGVIGAALGRWARRVHMTDVNLLAVECARVTARLNPLGDAQVYPSDVYSDVPDTRFDLIISNPPFHKGFDVSKDAAARIISGAAEHLKPGGRLVLVANVFLPYERIMQAGLGRVRTLAQDNRYKVLVGEH